MDIAEKLRGESSSGHVAFTEFILKHKSQNDSLFCFFEGKDDPKYYGIRIQGIIQKNYISIDCEGKENVILVKKLIEARKEYNAAPVAYFVDRDYDEHIKLKNLYCLPSYSIENQYVSKNVIEKILSQEFSLKSDDIDFNLVMQVFLSLSSEFHNKTKFINAWLACQNDIRKSIGMNTRLKIDNMIGKYFKSPIVGSLSGVSDYSDLNKLEKIEGLFPDAPKITLEEVLAKINTFNEQELLVLFRGKFELAFVVNFLEKLKSEIGRSSPVMFSKKCRCSLRFEQPTFLTMISIYANTPQCLVSYLKERAKLVA